MSRHGDVCTSLHWRHPQRANGWRQRFKHISRGLDVTAVSLLSLYPWKWRNKRFLSKSGHLLQCLISLWFFIQRSVWKRRLENKWPSVPFTRIFSRLKRLNEIPHYFNLSGKWMHHSWFSNVSHQAICHVLLRWSGEISQLLTQWLAAWGNTRHPAFMQLRKDVTCSLIKWPIMGISHCPMMVVPVALQSKTLSRVLLLRPAHEWKQT